MQLEISNHKKADLSTMKKNAKKILIPLLGMTLSLTLCSGCSSSKKINKSNNNIVVEQTIQTKDNIVIPSEYKDNFSYYGYEIKSSYSSEDLKQIKTLDITIRENDDLSWINSCTNLENLTITLHTNGDNLKQIGELQNLKKVNLYIMPLEGAEKNLDVENLAFIKNNKSITSLSLGSSFESANNQNIFNYLCNESNITDLSLPLEAQDNIDFTKMKSLKNLNLLYSKPYDIAIFLTKDLMNVLEERGCNITTNPGVLEIVNEINEELNNIVSILNLNENSTDQEKLDAILIYILDNYNYDEQVAFNSKNNSKDSKLNASFYKEGALYAVFNNDGNIICGNYAALFKALANRVGLESYYIISQNHAWNLVNIEDDYYYVDSTWLDGKTFSHITFDKETMTSKEQILTSQDKIKNHETNNLEWYMENPLDFKEKDSLDSHEALNLPDYIDYKNDEDITNKEFKIKIGTKEYIIIGAALVGILSALGLAVKVKHNRKKYSYEDDYEYNNYSYGSGRTFL